jgi:hypothetical protein
MEKFENFMIILLILLVLALPTLAILVIWSDIERETLLKLLLTDGIVLFSVLIFGSIYKNLKQ